MGELHPYEIAFRSGLDKFSPALWQHLDSIPHLPSDVSAQVLTYLLGFACQAQNAMNINLGRKALLAIPRAWLIQHIPGVAEPLLALEDEWEYRRLLEVSWQLDRELTQNVAERASRSPDWGIREAGQKWLEILASGENPESFSFIW